MSLQLSVARQQLLWKGLLFAVLGLAGGPTLAAQVAKEQPVGLVLAAQGGQLLRAGTALPLTAKPGDILFAGDSLTSGRTPVSALYCPDKSSVVLAPEGEFLFEARQLRVKSGRLTDKKAMSSCFLPVLERVSVASQQHYGVSITRAGLPPVPSGSFESRLQALAEAQRTALLAELGSLDKASAADPKEPAIQLARAGLFEKYNLKPDAAAEYRKLAEKWPDAVWIESRLFVLEEEPPPAAEPGAAGKLYALLIGISRYQSPQIRPLHFAHQDANVFYQYLKSARGGQLPDSDVVLLTDERATTAAIRNAFETFLKVRAGKNDTVVLFIAAHGAVEPGRGAHLVTYDSDPQDLTTTALPMADVQKLLREDLSRAGRVMAYVDACRSGTIGAIVNRTTSVNSNIEKLGEVEGEFFLFTASRAKEVSYEGPQYGGGHGAFTYFLLSAMNGEADRNNDGKVSMNEVIDYVRSKVAEGTYDRQHPRDLGTMETAIEVANTKQEGIRLLKWTGPPPKDLSLLAQASGAPEVASRSLDPSPAPALSVKEAVDFGEALAGGRLLPEEPGSAFAILKQLRPRLSPQEYVIQENRLRVALEDKGQQVLLRYLTGDQIPQTRSDFAAGAAYFQAAKVLTPESLLLESRASFCLGRTKVFDKEYRQATGLLERAARIDPSGAYSYNALGIAYLEEADYNRAILAFKDATRRAPYWAYPLHNLALAYTEIGDYQAAIASYRQAMRLAPQYTYLPYNLGLVYQRVNRRKEAEAAYRKAIALSPDLGEPYNALGYLQASTGHASEAERLYRQSLEKNPDLLAARHNLAVLLAGKPERVSEAIGLWHLNLSKSPEYLPSRLSLARALGRQGRIADAIEEYLAVVKLKPDYVAARLALAELQTKNGDSDAALDQLKEALQRQPENGLIYEQIGNLEKSRGRTTEAAAAYQSAWQHAPDAAARKRVSKNMEVRGR